jgi:site-specific DNA-cytosine methylase
LCTGYGGLDLAVELVLGGQLAWYAETDSHAQTVLRRRWPGIVNLGDIRTVDWTGCSRSMSSPPDSPAKIIPNVWLS